MDHEKYMDRALELAEHNVKKGGGPFGALIVKDDTVVAEGANLVTKLNDPTAHAEIVAIRNACQHLNSFQLTDCIVYSSCEPCPMCFGAIFWARPQAVYYAATAQDAAAIGFDDAYIYEELSKVHAERSIPFYWLEHSRRQEPFRAWQEYDTKIKY
jgi:guanine deaminase